MKQILIIVVFAVVAISVCSCKKTSQQVLRPSFEKVDDGSSFNEQAKVIAGSWQTATWQLFQTEESGTLLRGKIHIDEQQPAGQEYVKFVFLRSRGREEWVNQPLPMTLQTYNGDFEMNYDIIRESLSISIRPNSNFNLPDVTEIADLEYRYILVPVEIFSGMTIDWRDYNAVAEALNI
jgi:hypothetical protein